MTHSPPPTPPPPGALGKPPWRLIYCPAETSCHRSGNAARAQQRPAARLAVRFHRSWPSCVFMGERHPRPPAGAPPPEAPSPRCRLGLLRGPGRTEGHTFVRHFVTSSWRHQRGAEAPTGGRRGRQGARKRPWPSAGAWRTATPRGPSPGAGLTVDSVRRVSADGPPLPTQRPGRPALDPPRGGRVGGSSEGIARSVPCHPASALR